MDELPCRVSTWQDEEVRILATLDENVALTYLKYLLDRSRDLKSSPFTITIKFTEYCNLAGHTGLYERVDGVPTDADPWRGTEYKLSPFGEKVLRYALILDVFNIKKGY